jgi:methylthioribose-1-phosphate isomerase
VKPSHPAGSRSIASVQRPIWLTEDGAAVAIIDQRQLPHRLHTVLLRTLQDAVTAIATMMVRGAPLIGVTGAWGFYLATRSAPQGDPLDFLSAAADALIAARPTAVNLAWAVDRALARVRAEPGAEQRVYAARCIAEQISAEEVDNCRRIGEHGLPLIDSLWQRQPQRPVQILTHCNAGWLACVEHGTATAPIYAALDRGIPVHVWVDETRPLNQGARLTAWELERRGVPHTVVVDNAGGHLMQHGQVDMVIVGSDRTTASGDVANKIGTYLKALAARDNGIPFYVALPSSTIDWSLNDGVRQIPIEERAPEEVRSVEGWTGTGLQRVWLTPAASPAANFAFDVTPARLVTALITERGICPASLEGIQALFPDLAAAQETTQPSRRARPAAKRTTGTRPRQSNQNRVRR